MRRLLLSAILLGLCIKPLLAQVAQTGSGTAVTIKMSANVCWWAGIIEDGFKMPLTDGYHINTWGDNDQNQVQPLLLSSQGNTVWSQEPFTIRCQAGKLLVESESGLIFRHKSGNTLRSAFLYASSMYFPASGKTPDELLFSHPQYNTWIELMHNQNQAGILKYARGIMDHGFPPGVLMIDDGWQQNYGEWKFDRKKISNPESMIDKLHADGFKVMLWVCPFINPDCDVYRVLAKQGLLLKDDTGKPAIVKWWDGVGALLDFTNHKAVDWFRSQLNYLQATYHVDGFKFDGGDSSFYRGATTAQPTSPNAQTELYGKIGLNYPFNEYRAMWKMGGQPLDERLSDKTQSWTDLRKLIPDMILEGLMGYPFSCPDMIGGGEFTSFLAGKSIDQELLVRSAQCQALMPMMQFSVAPWRVLDKVHLGAVRKAVRVREEHVSYILNLVKHAASSDEPVVRSMEYEYPHQGYARVADQFMLGNKILVAPVLDEGATNREVIFPKGLWKGFDGRLYQGPATILVSVPYDDLGYFERIK
jgi:alpha-glucosidase (family GH31 glycosyl hydrolase)